MLPVTFIFINKSRNKHFFSSHVQANRVSEELLLTKSKMVNLFYFVANIKMSLNITTTNKKRMEHFIVQMFKIVTFHDTKLRTCHF